jgi:hypothetical protein
MKLERALTEKSYLYFAVFLLFVFAAFWLTYFTKLFEQENYRMHLHGITLVLWCLMLLIQPLLIKLKKTKLHTSIGKTSYILVPILLFTTMDLLIYRIRTKPSIDYTFVALVTNSLIAFIILYGLAIYYRKKSSIHARYMLSTVFPFFTPVTDRIIEFYFPNTLGYFPLINGYPNVPLFGFLLADLIIIGLCMWDWKSHKRYNVFPLVLIILLLYHYSFNQFYKYDFWRSFSEWLIS